jgi:hypothetical protein
VRKPAVVPAFVLGFSILGALLLPTFREYGFSAMVSSNLKVVDIAKLPETAVTLFTRYLSFAAYEIPRFLGKNTSERLEFFSTYPFAAPFVVVLVLAGFVQVFLPAVHLFKPSDGFARQAKSWWVVSYLVLLAMFCFSVKGPSSHTFYLFFPLSVVYAFSVWRRFVSLLAFKICATVCFVCMAVYTGCMIHHQYHDRSLYLDKTRVEEAIQKKNFQLLGERRKFAKY